MSAARPSRRARPRTPPTTGSNPAGVHALADHIARRLVRDARIGPNDLVLEVGAGLGAVTGPLARTGARILAVERDERIARRLGARMAGCPNVTVVTAEALAVPLPRRPYRVVANIPFGITTALLRRLVGSRLVTADLVVELAAARRLAAEPDRPELAAWQRRFAFVLGPVIAARWFRPEPSVDAAVLRLRRRPAGAGGPGGATGWRTPRSGPAHR